MVTGTSAKRGVAHNRLLRESTRSSLLMWWGSLGGYIWCEREREIVSYTHYNWSTAYWSEVNGEITCWYFKQILNKVPYTTQCTVVFKSLTLQNLRIFLTINIYKGIAFHPLPQLTHPYHTSSHCVEDCTSAWNTQHIFLKAKKFYALSCVAFIHPPRLP